MKTEINWKDPNIENPPFAERILVLLGGTGSSDCMRTFEKYVHICDVVMKLESPNDDEPGSEHQAFIDDERGPECFDDYQFCLQYWHDNEFGDDEDQMDWYSDAIVAWAPMPDFSEVLK